LIKYGLESVCFLKYVIGKNEMNLQTKNVKNMLSFALTICVLFSMLAVVLPSATAASPLEVSYLTLAPGSDASQLTFSWHTTDKAINPVVRICTQGSEASEFIGTSSDAVSGLTRLFYNRVTVTDLAFDTTYTYQVGNGNGDWSVEYTTKTGNPNEFSYIVVGDPQIGSSGNVNTDTANWVNTMNVIAHEFPNAVFMAGTGDQIETTGTLSQYTGFFSPAQMSSLPFASAMGNHEGNDVNTRTVYNPPNADSVQNYWYRYGDTLFLVWNCVTGTTSDMSAFLNDAIAQNEDATWRILNFHYDVYGQGSSHALSDGKTYRDQYVPVIDEFNIDVVFNGHDHFYSRSYPMKWSGLASTSNTQGMQLPEIFDSEGRSIDPAGTVYFSLSSSTGSKYYSEAVKQPYTAFMPQSQSNRPHFSVVDITVNTFTCTTYQIQANGDLLQIDTYTIKKTIAADYSTVKEALIVAQALDRELYVNFADVDNAIAAVVYGLEITEQGTVDGFAKAIYDAIDSLQMIVSSATPSAYVTQLNDNKNDLTITITEELADGTTNTLTETFSINNNAADIYTVGSYRVYVDTKGNTQIRDCRIV
jgi:hypothetical protein